MVHLHFAGHGYFWFTHSHPLSHSLQDLAKLNGVGYFTWDDAHMDKLGPSQPPIAPATAKQMDYTLDSATFLDLVSRAVRYVVDKEYKPFDCPN